MNVNEPLSKDVALVTADAWGNCLSKLERVALEVYELKPSLLMLPRLNMTENA